MQKQSAITKRFQFFVVLIVLVMTFSMVSGVTRAADNPPMGKEKVDVAPVSLEEVKNFYSNLHGLKGTVGIVVEMEDLPAVLIYAQNHGNQTSALTINQVNLIQQKQNAFMESLQAVGIQTTELFRTQKVYNGIWLRVDASSLDKIAAMPGVKAIHPIIPKTVDLTTSVPLIGAPAVWGVLGNYQGKDVTIGIIDTGIDYIHYNFGGNGIYVGQDFTTLDEPANAFPTAKVVGGWDFVGDAYNADPASPSYNPIPAPDPDPMDCYGHGSHVAGITAGYGVTSDGSTYVESGDDTYAALKNLSVSEYINKFKIGPGVAPKAKLYSLRVFGCQGSTDVTDAAIEWAVDPNQDGDLSDHLDVINMSLGSSFGSEYDTSAVASNNAAQAGVIVVASAGNSGDVYYVTGSPAVAKNAISVASSVDAGAVMSAFKVTGNTATSPLVPPGLYPASGAVFGPQTYSQPGDLAYFSPTDLGCAAYPAGFFTGKIALINRGTCTFVIKVKNAQDGGAVGVLMVNNSNSFPVAMGGSDATITIPSMMTTLALGTSIKTDMSTGTVSILLTTDYPDSVIMTDPTVIDTLSSFSSRGPGRSDTILKPDITAPGDTIFSTKNGYRSQGVSMSGTSMASPHVAGVMALLKEEHPDWSVAELKALVMNTATQDLWTDTAHSGKFTPTRVGAGRVSVDKAGLSPVIVFSTDDPGQVSLSFGEQAVLGTQTFVKGITLMNTGNAPAQYNVTFTNYYQINPGLTFSLMDANNGALSNPVSIPAGSTLKIKVGITANASLLTRARDATITTGARTRMAEGGGYVILTSLETNPDLRLPVHIAARPASAMGTIENRIQLPATATGTFSLTPAGTPVATADDVSKVTILELKDIDPAEIGSTGINSDADMQYVGAMSDYPTYPFAASSMYFGISTYGKWDTPNAVEFDVYVDVNKDGIDDYRIFNTNQAPFTGTTDDVMITAYCDLHLNLCSADYYTNGLSGSTNTNLFNNNVMVLPVGLTSIGLVDGVNTSFNFYVVSYSMESPWAVDTTKIMTYDVVHQSFGTSGGPSGWPMWTDNPAISPAFTITYDKTAIADNGSLGLLLLHHYNATNTAQVLDFKYKIFAPFTSK